MNKIIAETTVKEKHWEIDDEYFVVELQVYGDFAKKNKKVKVMIEEI